MKKILFLLAIFPLYLNAQDISEVVQVDGKSANDLFVSGKEWFVTNFKSAKDVLEMDEPNLGKLIGKGYTRIENQAKIKGTMGIPAPVNLDLTFTVNIATRDGRYKYEISGIHADDGSGLRPFSYHKNLLSLLEACNTEDGAKKYLKYQGQKSSNFMVKATMQMAPVYADNIRMAENMIHDLVKSLKIAMAGTEDDW